MRLRSKTPTDAHGRELDEAAIYVCFESYCTIGPGGEDVFATAGMRRPGSDPLVRKAPRYWYPDGAPVPQPSHLREAVA